MLSRFLLATALALVSAIGWRAPPAAAAGPAPAPPAAPAPAGSALPKGDPVVARVDGVELHLSDVEAVQHSLPAEAQKLPLAQIYPVLLDRLVNGQLVLDAAKKQHLDQDPEFQHRLDLYRDRLLQETYVEQLIKNATTEDQLKAGYQKFVQTQAPREQVRARQILVKTEAEAKSIIGQLDKGADFATLAKKYSTDPGAASGGELGYFSRDDMVPAFATAAFALKPGQYTKTPVKTEFGWHVILVEDRRTKGPPSFDESREEVSRRLARDVVQAQLKQLRSTAKIEEFGLDGKPLPAAQ